MHSLCPHSTISPARRAEFLAQILEPAYQSSPTPSTSSLPPHSPISTKTTSTTKAYKDCQGILHDPEWRYFPTEEWKKQRREQRRRSQYQQYQQQTEWDTRRGSFELDEEDLDLEYSGRSMMTMSMSGKMGDDGMDVEDEWDEKEYAFGGRKNRNRYRSFGYSTSPRSEYYSPSISSPPTSISSPPITPALVLSRASSRSSDADEEVPSTPQKSKKSRMRIPKLFKPRRGSTASKSDEYEYAFDSDVEVDVVPSSAPTPTNGLGLFGIDSTPTPTPSVPTSPTSPTSPSSPKLSSSLSTLRSKAYKQYLAVELSITLGVVRTERKLRDWHLHSQSGAGRSITSGSF